MSLGQHSVVLQLGLSQHWGVTCDDDQLGLTRSQSLDGRLVTQGVLTGFDNQTQLGVNVLGVLVLWGLDVSTLISKLGPDKSAHDTINHLMNSVAETILTANYTDHLCVFVLHSGLKMKKKRERKKSFGDEW